MSWAFTAVFIELGDIALPFSVLKHEDMNWPQTQALKDCEFSDIIIKSSVNTELDAMLKS